MPYNEHITLDGKKYKVTDQLYEPTINRQRQYAVGLTGVTLFQDFTVSNRVPQFWNFMLKIFISDPEPDNTYAIWSDFLTAYHKNFFDFTDFDGVTTHEVGIPTPITQIPRVYANIEGHCSGVFYVQVQLLKRQV